MSIVNPSYPEKNVVVEQFCGAMPYELMSRTATENNSTK